MRCYFSEDAVIRDATPVDNLFIMEYMPRASGAQVSVYLYGLMLCRFQSIEQDIGEALMLSPEEVLDAFSYWQREGLVFIRGVDPLKVEYALPNFRQAPLLIPGKYNSLVQATQSLLAPRQLGAGELRRVYDWVDVFSLEESAILELVAYCKTRKGERVSMKYMDAVAQAWADQGVRTREDARKQIAAHEALTGGAADILKRWNISRAPTKDEIESYELWTGEWGFTPGAIQAACPAVLNADRPSFAYLGSVLERLKVEGTFNEDEVTSLILNESSDKSRAKQILQRMGVRRSPSNTQIAEIKSLADAGIELDALLFAAELASGKEKAYQYFKRVMQAYVEKGIKTLVEAKAKELPKPAAKDKGIPDSLDYEQKTYTEAELQHFYI